MRITRLPIVAFLVVTTAGFCQSDSAPLQDWTHRVRIGGYGLSHDRAEAIVRDAVETHVFGIETDNDITGRYESFLEPQEKLKAIQAVAEKAHAAGNFAFVYIAGLECITAQADRTSHTFFKDHPDWVQRKITGEPAVFGGGAAFWIAPGDEDVWISPYAAEWRRIYMERVRQIAATGIDGIYVDIPYWMTHFEGWEESWASFDDYTVEAFRAKTGLNAKTEIRLGDFTDPGFLRWIDFRIQTLTDFMKEVDTNAQAVNPQCKTIAEIYPGIEEAAVRVGTDVYQLYGVVDAIAHEYEWGSGNAIAASKTPLDWLHYMIGMFTFRAFADGKASWMLSYSWDGERNIDPRDAMKNLFMSQLIAGTNSWDAQGHVMSHSNDLATRTGVFQWIAQHDKTFYSPRLPINPVGVYFSPQTRNYFPLEFIESYLGTMALVIHSHRELQVVTPRSLAEFKGNVLILPDVRCLSQGELDSLKSFVQTGKKLVITAETARYDERRDPRTPNPLHTWLGIQEVARKSVGAGRQGFVYLPDCPGKQYFRQLAKEFDLAASVRSAPGTEFEKLREAFMRDVMADSSLEKLVQVEASPFVVAQIASVNGKPHVFLANFKGLKGRENAQQIPEKSIRIHFPAGTGRRVFALPFLGEAKEVRPERGARGVDVAIPTVEKGMVVWCE
ncbi:MAG: hypothetical protein LAO07_10635 [Acidobacteriia bacterium]|nr:hypothetical protein [Terriglobia bacterium]